MLLKKGLIWMKPVRNSGSMNAMYSSMFTRGLLVLGTLGVAEAGLIFSDEDYATERNDTTSLLFIKVIDWSFLARVLIVRQH